MIRKSDVQNKVSCYLREQLDVQSFRDWLIEAQLDESQVELAAKNLLSEIEGRYAEFSDGLISEASFNNFLRHLGEQVFAFNIPNAEVCCASVEVLPVGNVFSVQHSGNAPLKSRIVPSDPAPIPVVLLHLVG